MRPSPILWASLLLVAANTKGPKQVTIVEFTDDGQRKGVVTVDKIIKTDAEWRKLLTPEQFRVTRQSATELACSGGYWNNHEDGSYRCVCCGTALFKSDAKFESGTGWPSFFQPLPKRTSKPRPISPLA